MSPASDLIRRLQRSGVRLEARGDQLHVEAGKGAITPELRALLVNRKADLLRELDPAGTRARLLAAAAAEHADPGLIHRLPRPDVDACDGLPDRVLRAYVRALQGGTDDMAARFVPRPTITCGSCKHYQPDDVNPVAGVGACSSGQGTHYPMQRHRCELFHPNEANP